MSVVGFDDIALASKLDPGLTTIRIGWDSISSIVIDKLNVMLRDHNSFNGKNFHTPVELITRKSTAKISTGTEINYL